MMNCQDNSPQFVPAPILSERLLIISFIAKLYFTLNFASLRQFCVIIGAPALVGFSRKVTDVGGLASDTVFLMVRP